MPALARKVAAPGLVVDPAGIGRAARQLPHHPATPEGDPAESDLQQLKYLWHVLFAYGHDAAAAR